jgi:hypothetical protein
MLAPVKSVVRSILAVFLGFVTASAVMLVVESINGKILYPELGDLGAGMTDPAQIRALLATAPVGAFLVVLFGWALGSFVGGFVATWLGKQPPYRHALILGVLLTLAGIANNLMVPPPLWFWIVGLFVFIPAACAGARAVPRATAQVHRFTT